MRMDARYYVFETQLYKQLEKGMKLADYPEGSRIIESEKVKENGITQRGLSIQIPEETISPVIYLEPYYTRFLDGDTRLWEMAQSILKLDVDLRQEAMNFGVSVTDLSYEKAREHLYIRACETAKSGAYLEDKPHLEQGNLSATYYIQAGKGKEISIAVTGKLMAYWGIGVGQLHEDALTCMGNGEVLYDINEVVETMMSVPGSEPENLLERFESGKGFDLSPMYVLSNREKMYGAGNIFNPELLAEVGDLIGQDYYVLPSSKHELILVPETLLSYREAVQMVYTTNRSSNIRPEDVLSDEVQIYDNAQKKLMTWEEYTEQKQEQKEAQKEEQEQTRKEEKHPGI